jgi:hypothetical protein
MPCALFMFVKAATYINTLNIFPCLLPFVFVVHGALIETTMLSVSFGASADIGCSFSNVSFLMIPCA